MLCARGALLRGERARHRVGSASACAGVYSPGARASQMRRKGAALVGGLGRRRGAGRSSVARAADVRRTALGRGGRADLRRGEIGFALPCTGLGCPRGAQTSPTKRTAQGCGSRRRLARVGGCARPARNVFGHALRRSSNESPRARRSRAAPSSGSASHRVRPRLPTECIELLSGRPARWRPLEPLASRRWRLVPTLEQGRRGELRGHQRGRRGGMRDASPPWPIVWSHLESKQT